MLSGNPGIIRGVTYSGSNIWNNELIINRINSKFMEYLEENSAIVSNLIILYDKSAAKKDIRINDD